MRVLESGRLVLPATEPAARRWAEEHLLSLHPRRRRLLAAVGRVRLSGTVREADGGAPASLLGIAPAALAAAIERAGVPHDVPWVLQRRYAPGAPGGVLALIDRASGDAAAVVKARPVAQESRLAHEARLLATVRPALPPSLGETLPRVLHHGRSGDLELLVLSAVRGRPLSLAMQRALRPVRSHLPHLEAAGRWLARLHRATASDGEVVVHGDPWPRNLLFDGRRLTGVVDWEHGRFAGDPEEDLFALPLLLAAEAPRWRTGGTRTGAAAFAAAFLERGALARATHRFLAAYREELGIAGGPPGEWLERSVESGARRAGKEEDGWPTRFPWAAVRERLAAHRGAFSG